MSEELDTDVLVVGAGPTGLLLAVVLQRAGIRMTVIDGKSGPTRESRAVVVQARTMEIFDQLGIAEATAGQSEYVARVTPGYGRRPFGSLRFGALATGITPYPRLTVLEQSRTETILYDHLRALGGDVRWGTSLESLTDDGDRVSAAVEGPDGRRSVRARYCVAADGKNSAVRRLAGIPFEGVTNDHTFYVCDATEVRGIGHDAVNVRLGDVDMLLAFPMTGPGRQRLIGTVPTADDAAEADVTEKAVRPRVAETYGVTWGESQWFSTYRVHHRVAAAFRQGRLFLAGDAAHVHSPVGAQGMNTGLQDAHNLALKLVDVLRGRASDAFLDRYEAERRPVALRLVSTTDRIFWVVTSRRWRERMLRRWVVPFVAPLALSAVAILGLTPRMFGYLSQTRIHYWMSAGAKAAASGRRDPVVGRRLPWTGRNFAVLRSLQWQVHGYGGIAPADAARLRTQLDLDVHTFPATRRSPLQRRTFYLVRPDGFVAAKAAPEHAVAVFAEALPWEAAPPSPRHRRADSVRRG